MRAGLKLKIKSLLNNVERHTVVSPDFCWVGGKATRRWEKQTGPGLCMALRSSFPDAIPSKLPPIQVGRNSGVCGCYLMRDRESFLRSEKSHCRISFFPLRKPFANQWRFSGLLSFVSQFSIKVLCCDQRPAVRDRRTSFAFLALCAIYSVVGSMADEAFANRVPFRVRYSG